MSGYMYIRYTGMCHSNGSLLCKKSLNMGYDFVLDIPKHGSHFRENHTKQSNFWSEIAKIMKKLSNQPFFEVKKP